MGKVYVASYGYIDVSEPVVLVLQKEKRTRRYLEISVLATGFVYLHSLKKGNGNTEIC